MNFGAAQDFSAAVQRGAPWLAGAGADSDVVVSSRVRLARNITGYPFLTRASRAQRQQILDACRDRLMAIQAPPPASPPASAAQRHMAWISVHEAAPLDRTLMVERHLISKEHARGVVPGASKSESESAEPRTEPRGVAISFPDERISVMVNEEDHLRMQVLLSGLELSAAFELATQLDDQFEGARTGVGPGPRDIAYAFSQRFGFLTACPTNVGTGIRFSVMLHLPALKLTGEIEKVKRATRDMSVAVRGYYGEGSESSGEFFQVSNQTTLGTPESVILHSIEREIVPQIIAYERAARKLMLEKRLRSLEDRVFRALGLLRSARLLSPEEAITHLSDVRLGIVTGLIAGIEQQTVNQLILLTQPAHLQRALGREMDQGERREARADMVRERLKA